MTVKPLTARQAAAALGIAISTLKRIHPRDLPYFTFGDRQDRRYMPLHVEKYIERRMVG